MNTQVENFPCNVRMLMLFDTLLLFQVTEEMKELYHHKPERFQRRDLMRVFSFIIDDFPFQKHVESEKKCSGHVHNQTPMVCPSSQLGKREESPSGAEEAERKTFPLIRADFDFARFHFQR